MAKTSSIEKNNKRRKRLVKQFAKQGAEEAIIMDRTLPMEERFRAQLKLAASCRATRPPRPASATAAKSPAVRAPITAS
jgi:small subunit ribosomal protein S14